MEEEEPRIEAPRRMYDIRLHVSRAKFLSYIRDGYSETVANWLVAREMEEKYERTI